MKEKIKSFFKKFLLIDDSPHRVAAGAAVGVFLGIVPGEGVTASIVVALIFRLNRLAAIAGSLATNMWTTFVVLSPAAWIGGMIFGISYQNLINNFKATHSLAWKEIFSKFIFWNVALPLLVGFAIVAGIIAIGFYLTIYFYLKKHKIDLSDRIEKKFIKK